MNGRIYDPLIGRFLTGDLMVQDPSDLQSFNRYSYVRNNPLSRVDPSGFADIELIDQNDPAHHGGTLVPSGGANATTINAHGGSGGNGVYTTDPATGGGGTQLQAADLNRELTANGHTQGNEIRAYICNGGVGQNRRTLQAVAAAQNSPVIAATGTIAPVVSRNRTTGADTWVRAQVNGRLVRIDPNGTVRDYGTPRNAARADQNAIRAQNTASNLSTTSTQAQARATAAGNAATQAAANATQASAAATQARAAADAAKGTPTEKAEAQNAARAEKTAKNAQRQATRAQNEANDANADAAKAAQRAAEAAQRAQEAADLARQLHDEANRPF